MHSLSLSPSHHPDLTVILLQGCKIENYLYLYSLSRVPNLLYRVSAPFEGRNLFSVNNMFGDNWVYISNTAYDDGFIFEYGRMWELINSPADTRPTLEEGLDEMTITVRLKEGAGVTLIPGNFLGFFRFFRMEL